VLIDDHAPADMLAAEAFAVEEGHDGWMVVGTQVVVVVVMVGSGMG